MSVFEIIIERAKQNPPKLAFPEATEEKMLLAVQEAAGKGICIPVLVGDPEAIQKAAADYGVDIAGMEIFDATAEAAVASLAEKYVAINPLASVKGMLRKAKDFLYTALMLEAIAEVSGTFAGLSHSTGEVIMAGQYVIGLKEGVETVSSFGVWDLPGFEGSEGSLLAHGDAAVSANPTSSELAYSAIGAAEAVQQLFGWEPRVAMLSFSTDGSSEHDLVSKVREAVRIANEKRPDLLIDGEFQLDTAVNPATAKKKLQRESGVAGRANVVIFPDLNAGNIGVKLVQQFAHVSAPGPFLLGLNKVVGDCSRGAPLEELVGNIAVTAVRAQGDKK